MTMETSIYGHVRMVKYVAATGAPQRLTVAQVFDRGGVGLQALMHPVMEDGTGSRNTMKSMGIQDPKIYTWWVMVGTSNSGS